MKLIQRSSPNCRDTRQSTDFIILHGTWLPDDESALAAWCDSSVELSCHYYISYDAEVYQLVPDELVAYHAGISQWGGVQNLNDYSLGIEIANPGVDKGVPYTEEQYTVLIELLRELMAKHHIKPANILAHSDIAPDRKDDPGPHFEWERLAGLGVKR